MITKKIVIIVLATACVVLNGMLVLDKKTKKTKSGKSLQEHITPSEETSLSPAYSKKLPVKNLNDTKALERARSEFRDKTGVSKSESSVDKK
jgi:hypothetical protein